MKALVIPEENKGWQLEDFPTPTIGDNDLLVKVQASGICYSDIHMTRGEWGIVFPVIPGHEVVGTIERVGKNVTGFHNGERVGLAWDQQGCNSCKYCIQGKIEFCPNREGTGVSVAGGCAEYLKVPSGDAVRIPDKLTSLEAAPLLCAGYSVYGGLIHANIKPGQTVAVLGIGGLGHLGIQYANAFGAKVIALTRGTTKNEFATSLGAHFVVDVNKEDWFQEILELGGADIILAPTLSKKHMYESIFALAPEGTLVVLGEAGNLELPISELISGRKKIMGSVHGPRKLLRETLDFAAFHDIRPIIEVFKIDEYNKALEKLISGDIRFRAVLSFE